MKIFLIALLVTLGVVPLPADAKEKFIFVSFTLKNQNFETQILPVLKELKKENPGAVLVHGFASRQFLVAKHIPTDVLDALDDLFADQQKQIVNEKGVADATTRQAMADMARETSSRVYVIGDENASGVAEEVKLYRDAGVKVEVRPVD